ncbi:hypothetical protein GYA89_29445 [Rhodococcus qingshengii]|nr:hypothetical protein [Rhodococcus qingshengii]
MNCRKDRRESCGVRKRVFVIGDLSILTGQRGGDAPSGLLVNNRVGLSLVTQLTMALLRTSRKSRNFNCVLRASIAMLCILDSDRKGVEEFDETTGNHR